MTALLSVITPSLNHGRFLPDTIASIKDQSYPHVEHVVVDGGSTDDTVAILKKSPWIRWISEPDESILDAYRKAIALSTGEYVIQCCVSDGFLDRDWFARCAEVLDAQPDVSLVWGLPRYMSEEGVLGSVSYRHFLRRPAPQKMDFLPFWLASGFILPEGNYCVRREVLEACFPHDSEDEPFRVNPVLPFNYAFNVSGYLPYFLPVIANFGRTHEGQRGQRLRDVEVPLLDRYHAEVREVRAALVSGARRHVFRDGASRELKEASSEEIRRYREYAARNTWAELKERIRLKFRRELKRMFPARVG